MQNVEAIIVGQGMAGTALATEFLKQNKSFVVIDNNHYLSSSIMSAGMYNPIVFKRITKSWLADEALPVLHQFCEYMHNLIGNSFHTDSSIIRLFNNLPEQNTWFEKMDSPLFQEFLKDEILDLPPHVINKHGFGVVKKAGSIDLGKLLPAFKEFLWKQNLLLNEKFDYLQLSNEGEFWKYKDIQSKTVIFCEGVQGLQNPFFSWIPIKPNKGQLLTIKCPELCLKEVVNAGFFIQPLNEDLYRVGSTYEWNKTDVEPTPDKKEELIKKLHKVISCSFEVVCHTAGIRPTVTDRRPLIGEHPEKKGLFLFNGFGTKAVMLAPYWASLFMGHMFKNESLHPEVNLNRYYKFYKDEF